MKMVRDAGVLTFDWGIKRIHHILFSFFHSLSNIQEISVFSAHERPEAPLK